MLPTYGFYVWWLTFSLFALNNIWLQNLRNVPKCTCPQKYTTVQCVTMVKFTCLVTTELLLVSNAHWTENISVNYQFDKQSVWVRSEFKRRCRMSDRIIGERLFYLKINICFLFCQVLLTIPSQKIYVGPFLFIYMKIFMMNNKTVSLQQ